MIRETNVTSVAGTTQTEEQIVFFMPNFSFYCSTVFRGEILHFFIYYFLKTFR